MFAAPPSNVIPLERVAEALAQPAIEEPPVVEEIAVEEPPFEDEIEAVAEAMAVAEPQEQGLSEENRVKLEILLGELLNLKARLRAG